MRPAPTNDGYFHIYNRGALKHSIFFEKTDYLRFIQSLFTFNDLKSSSDHGRPTSEKREPLVSILAWCLMPNHYHLFLKQIRDGGLSLFMKKLGGGYTKYINTKYNRSGHLFQGKYKFSQTLNDSYFIHLSRYIHSNPNDLIEMGQNLEHFLEYYPWSSFPTWIGKNHFQEVVDNGLINELRGMSCREYRDFVVDWACHPTSNIGELKNLGREARACQS